jgi:hypothetical protein
MGASAGDEPEQLRIGRNPWTEKTLDAAVGCNKPTTPEAEQPVERLKKPVDGT